MPDELYSCGAMEHEGGRYGDLERGTAEGCESMTAKAQDRVWSSKLPHEWKYLGVALADQADDDGFCVYRDTSVRYLCEKTGLSESTVRRRIQEMLDPKSGVLIITKPATQHRGPEYRIMFDVIKNGSDELWQERMETVSRRPKKSVLVSDSEQSRGVNGTVQGCQRDTSGDDSRGVNGTVQGCQRDGQGCQRDGQGCQRDGSPIRCLDSPEIHQDSPRAPGECANGGEQGDEPERPATYAMGEHAFQVFKTEYPKISGKFLNEDLARIEFLKSPGAWNMIIRGAKHYAASGIVRRCLEDGGKGIKFPNNFIRDGTWKDWQTGDVFDSEDEIMTRKAKEEVTRMLKREGGQVNELGPEGKKFFYSLHTHIDILRRMALEGKDIAGPQTAGIRDPKMLAAEGVAS